jgi:TPR repeat protein
MIKLLRTAAFLLCTAVATPAMAQNYAKEVEAFLAGDYETAVQEWRPLAEQGNAEAQYKIPVRLGALTWMENGNSMRRKKFYLGVVS